MATKAEPGQNKEPLWRKPIVWVGTIVTALVIEIVTGLGNPLGGILLKRVSPQNVAVEGCVQRAGAPVAGLLVVRDREYDWNAAYREVDGQYSTYTNDKLYVASDVEKITLPLIVINYLISCTT